MRPRFLLLAIVAVLVLTTLGAYRHAGQCGFVNLDDDAYVEFAPMVNKGIRSAALVWAVTAIHSSNWHPLTMISHMLDCELFGVKAAPMHWENVGWHLLNSVLVFLLWRRLSGAVWRSAFVAALFALHPLHVESVAWISSRKDLLCTFFWLLGLLAYVRWTARPSVGRYALILLCLALALLGKPVAVTFPATLLLLDTWPLRRRPAATWRQLVWEKLPLFGLAGLHAVVVFIVQHASGAAHYAERIPIGARLGNAVIAYARYLGKTVWPDALSPMYWHPGYWPAWAVLGALVLLGAVSTLAWRQRAKRPWLGFGWLWFLGTLVPMIGLIQVGAQSMADRYTYVPLLGVFTIIAWAGGELVTGLPRWRIAGALAAAAVLAACFVVTQRQVRTWENSIRLYESSLAAGEDNPAIRYLLGVALAAAGRPEADAAAQYRRAIELEPDYVNAHTQLAMIAMRHQRLDEAQAILEQNIRFEPKNESLHSNLGAFWSLRGDLARAMPHYEAALRLSPDNPGLHREMAQIAMRQNRTADARAHYEAAIRADGWNAMDYSNLGLLVGNLGNIAESRRLFQRALWIEPGQEYALRNLAALDQIEQAQKK